MTEMVAIPRNSCIVPLKLKTIIMMANGGQSMLYDNSRCRPTKKNLTKQTQSAIETSENLIAVNRTFEWFDGVLSTAQKEREIEYIYSWNRRKLMESYA